MTSINLLYIDDDQPQQVQGLIEAITSKSSFELNINHKPPTKMSEIATELRQAYDGIIIDQKLDNFVEGVEPVDYFGAALAQNLRTLMAGKADNISYKPIILLSLESLLIEYYNPDSSSHDLFDLVLSKSILEKPEQLEKKVQLIRSIVNAYKRAHSEDSLYQLLSLSNDYSGLDKRFEVYLSQYREDIHKRVTSIHSTLLRSSGMLVSEITLATRLGINIIESPDWHQIIGHLEDFKYRGIFSDYYKRWWWMDVELWINEKLNCPIIKGLTSDKRVKIIKEKLGLEQLAPIQSIHSGQSTKFWVNCIISKEPLDTIDALRVSSMELKPWENDKYLSIETVLNRRAEKYKIHPEDRTKLERIRARFKL
ncbi:TPA: hypothetical protein KEX07_003070 [Proteus mirabilis]|nr:hypothetical protein [Proteus mirabilis]MBG6004318.1 hypothetical protein [Proteus mirabilis]HBC6576693.1 hypothetical protein [Proteus mirabilis]HEK0527781.1 hypothetical protein [Proteus mirabilis]HEK0668417.1 hypothetical protein [Proteus mirabilis]